MPTPVLQVGTRTVLDTELVPLLIQYQLLPQLCRELLIDQAIAGIECTLEETESALQQFYEVNQITEEAVRQDWLARTQTTLAQVTTLALRPLRIEKFKHQTWGNQLAAHFLGCKSELDQVVYSVIRTTQPEIAQELYFRIKAGEAAFADLARQYSEGPEAETDGLLGPVPLGQPHPALAEKLARSQPGQLSPPTRIGEWYVLFRLEKLLPAQLDEAMRQRFLDQFFQTWLQEQLANPQPVRSQPAPPALATL